MALFLSQISFRFLPCLSNRVVYCNFWEFGYFKHCGSNPYQFRWWAELGAKPGAKNADFAKSSRPSASPEARPSASAKKNSWIFPTVLRSDIFWWFLYLFVNRMADFTELRKALSPFIPLFPFRRGPLEFSQQDPQRSRGQPTRQGPPNSKLAEPCIDTPQENDCKTGTTNTDTEKWWNMINSINTEQC